MPEDLARIIHRTTQKDPDQRYQSAAEMAADLDRYLAGKPVVAPQYHYRLDEREIVAARPGSVVLAAFIMFLASLGLFLAFFSIGLMSGIMFMGVMTGMGATMMAVETVIGGVILATGIIVGRSLLAARIWSRWAAVVLFALLCGGSLLSMFSVAMMSIAISQQLPNMSKAKSPNTTVEQPTGEENDAQSIARNLMFGMFAVYAVPHLAALLMGAAGIWSLLSRKAGEWFTFAAQIRWEHRQMREQFQ